jgi:hypothetical protein
MNEIVTVTLLVITMILIAILVWMVLEHIKLKKNYLLLSDSVERNNQDIAGICSTAVFVDKKITGNTKYLRSVADQFESYDSEFQEIQEKLQKLLEQPEVSATPTQFNAVPSLRKSEDIDELIQQSEVSREETELLMRLHQQSSG